MLSPDGIRPRGLFPEIGSNVAEGPTEPGMQHEGLSTQSRQERSSSRTFRGDSTHFPSDTASYEKRNLALNSETWKHFWKCYWRSVPSCVLTIRSSSQRPGTRTLLPCVHAGADSHASCLIPETRSSRSGSRISDTEISVVGARSTCRSTHWTAQNVRATIAYPTRSNMQLLLETRSEVSRSAARGESIQSDLDRIHPAPSDAQNSTLDGAEGGGGGPSRI